MQLSRTLHIRAPRTKDAKGLLIETRFFSISHIVDGIKSQDVVEMFCTEIEKIQILTGEVQRDKELIRALLYNLDFTFLRNTKR